jgi:transposase
MRNRLGEESAITVAHKLARIIYALVTKGVAYDEGHFAQIEKRDRQRQRQKLLKLAHSIGYKLVPATAAAVVS